MAFTLTDESAGFVASTLSNAHDLLDNVHCYDTAEYRELAIAIDIMAGLSLDEALAKNPEEENDEEDD